jgi:hypothetical protein
MSSPLSVDVPDEAPIKRNRAGSNSSVELPFDLGTVSPLADDEREKERWALAGRGQAVPARGALMGRRTKSVEKCIALALRTAVEDRDEGELWDVIRAAQEVGMKSVEKEGFERLEQLRRLKEDAEGVVV